MTSTDHFESQKNLKASGYTLMVCVLLLIIFLFVKWTLPSIPPPPEEEGIEVNLGNSDMGLGVDQPFLPGKPSPQDNQSYTPPKQVTAPVEEVKDIETDDKDPEAPAIIKPPVTKPQAVKVPEKDVVKTKPVKNPQPTAPPAPAPPKPKAVFKGVNGTGTGGNEADGYKKGGNEGIAGGTGDQGAPGGNPESDNYKGGGTGNSGVAKLRGLTGRNIIRRPSFEDDFNENAKVAVDIKVDEAGNVIAAEYQPRGSTTSDPGLKAIALKKARQVKFNPGSEESAGTLQFNFKLKS
jgi:outer membrane biosynthesis protein TonB